MFDNLMESRHVRRPRAGGSIASIALHAAAVAGLVAATANATVVAPQEAPSEKLIYTQAPLPEPTTRARQHDATTAATDRTQVERTDPIASAMPDLVDIPSVLPNIDLSRAVTSAMDFRRRGAAHGAAHGDSGAATARADDGGNGVFSERTVEKPVVLEPGSRAPDYPATLRAAGIEGTVLVQFVVDTAGRVEPRSWRVMRADHAAFADAVQRAMPALRFLPAEVGGRRVRQLVQLPFRFDLDRDR